MECQLLILYTSFMIDWSISAEITVFSCAWSAKVISVRGGVTLAGHQMPTNTTLSLPTLAGQGTEIMMEGCELR